MWRSERKIIHLTDMVIGVRATMTLGCQCKGYFFFCRYSSYQNDTVHLPKMEQASRYSRNERTIVSFSVRSWKNQLHERAEIKKSNGAKEVARLWGAECQCFYQLSANIFGSFILFMFQKNFEKRIIFIPFFQMRPRISIRSHVCLSVGQYHANV